jgi:hypothetical protein
MIKGLYLMREHLELVLESPEARGRVINKMTPPRHLDNDTFTTLLRYGWIGSCGTGTDFVREQVWKSLGGRGSVMIGTHSNGWPLGNGYGRQRSVPPITTRRVVRLPIVNVALGTVASVDAILIRWCAAEGRELDALAATKCCPAGFLSTEHCAYQRS